MRAFFVSREMADKKVNDLNDIIEQYGFATVVDWYELTGRENQITYIENNYGWFKHIDVKIMFNTLGYFVELPEATLINDANNISKKINVKRSSGRYPWVSKNNYESQDKQVSHPSHYQSSNGLEVIDAIEAFTGDLTGIEATDTGNVIKYICRWKKKNGLQDLEKAQWYLTHLINNVKSKEEN